MTLTLTDLVRSIRETLLDTPDTVCLERARLVTAAWAKHEHEPVAICRAKALAHVLANMTLDLQSNPVLAGNMSSGPRAWMLNPEYGFAGDLQVSIENESLRGHLDGKVPADLLAFWKSRSTGGGSGVGHLAVDMDRVVHHGLASVLAEVRAHLDAGDADQRATRQAMVLCLEAVIAWSHRYADAAAAAADREPDPLRRACHERVAAACRHVPEHPARDLFEALQAMLLVHLAVHIEGHGMSVSLGSPDRVLAPFADEAEANGDATALIAAFLLKLADNAYLGSGSKTQTLTLGGCDADGRDRCNALTLRILDAWDLVRTGDPQVFVRWHDRLDPAVRRKVTDLLSRGATMPLLVGDAATAGGFIRHGVEPADAYDYCIIGCNELGIPGRLSRTAAPMGCSINYLATLNALLLEGDAPPRFETMDALTDALAGRMRRELRDGCIANERQWSAIARTRPTPLTSALMRGNAAAGRDLHAWQAIPLLGCYERGLTNAANALAAIEHLVFETARLSLAELVDAMRGDFAEPATRQLLRDAPKWGNDDDRVDGWALWLAEQREAALRDAEAELGQPAHLACHVVRSLHHVDGRRIAASPDGRRAHAPVADSIGAETGTAAAGPTAVLNSVLKLDAARLYAGGTNLNLTIPGREATPAVVDALCSAFFADGGQELQLSALSADHLRAAQQHPDRYRDLVVRIAGFSAVFVKLSRLEQDELIARADAAATGCATCTV